MKALPESLLLQFSSFQNYKLREQKMVWRLATSQQQHACQRMNRWHPQHNAQNLLNLAVEGDVSDDDCRAAVSS
jgi:hypothetical protein